MASTRFDFNTALHQCAQGKNAALKRIYEHEASQMLAYGLSLLESPSEAEELVRETFILSWKNSLGFDASLGDGRAWIYSIFRYRAQARLRQRGSGGNTRHAPSLPSPNSGATAFLRSVIRLDSVSRQILLIAYLQGSGYHDIGQRLSLPANQARSRLRAAVGQLRDSISTLRGRSLSEQQLLIAEYTLGLLPSAEHQQIQSLLQHDDQAAQDALAWEYELLAFCDGLHPVRPSDQLLWRIQTALGHETTESSPSTLQRSADYLKKEQLEPPNNTTFIPQLLRADSASSLSIPDRIEAAHKEPSVTPSPSAELLASTQSTEEAVDLSSETPEKAPPSIAMAFGAGLARLFPKKVPVAQSSSTKTEPSLHGNGNATSTDPDETPPPSDIIVEPIATPPAKPQSPPPTPPVRRTPIEPDSNDEPGKRQKAGPALWRSVAFIFAVTALGLGAKIALTPAEPPINVIEMAPTQAAVLQAPGQSSTPGWVLTVDPEGNVLLSPQVETEVLETQSVQLWTQTAASATPRSLGLIDPNRPVAIPAPLIGELETGQIFEITLESKGGAVSEMPSGPVLFIGRLVRFGDAPVPVQPAVTETS